jgi:hypothetical protein
MRGIKALNKAIQTEVKMFGIEDIRMADWGYYSDDYSIEYTLFENRIEDELFLDFVKERFNYKPLNNFMLSLFHEIGHHYTYDEATESDIIYDFCQAEKERIEEEMQTATSNRKIKKLEYEYFNLPDEIVATAWAVEYMREHEEEIKIMWEHILKAIHKFYEKNLDK